MSALLLILLAVPASAQQKPAMRSLQMWADGAPTGVVFENQGREKPAPVSIEDRRKAIEDIHSEAVIKPAWVPKFVADVPAFQIVEGPTVDKDGFFQRLWRVPLSPVIGAVGGAFNVGKQWAMVVGDGDDTFGAVGGAIAGGLFGLIAGALVGLAGVFVNGAMAIKNLVSGRF